MSKPLLFARSWFTILLYQLRTKLPKGTKPTVFWSMGVSGNRCTSHYGKGKAHGVTIWMPPSLMKAAFLLRLLLHWNKPNSSSLIFVKWAAETNIRLFDRGWFFGRRPSWNSRANGCIPCASEVSPADSSGYSKQREMPFHRRDEGRSGIFKYSGQPRFRCGNIL